MLIRSRLDTEPQGLLVGRRYLKAQSLSRERVSKALTLGTFFEHVELLIIGPNWPFCIGRVYIPSDAIAHITDIGRLNSPKRRAFLVFFFGIKHHAKLKSRWVMIIEFIEDDTPVGEAENPSNT